MGNMFAPYDMAPVTITPANDSFSGKRALDINGIEVVLKEVGPGHTDGDVIVWLPERETVYAGDILFIGGTPVI